MAYSLSPTSPSGPARRSATPPALPLSKKEKKRATHEERYQILKDDFAQNRDVYFRRQLLGLQHDMNLITQADLYQPEPIEDSPEEITRMVKAAAAGTPYQAELSHNAGKWYSKFVREVNEAKETKEVELTQLMTRHDDSLARIKQEHEFKLRLATEEYENLSSTLRERIVKQLSDKKSRLLKEKEHLDIADTNAILLHPSQFSITNPSSPGGAQGNRKTRHARHRQEMDDFSVGLLHETGNKRKRKLEESTGSPTRDGVTTPAERNKARVMAQQAAPLYSFSTLFSEKDLKSATSEAYIAATHFFATSKKNSTGSGAASNGKDSDEEGEAEGEASPDEPDELVAPEMDRTASQTFHATRSTRNAAGGMAGMNLLSDLAEKAASRPPVPYFLLSNYNPSKNGAQLPPPPSLMPEEQIEDLSKFQELSKKPTGWVDDKLLDELCAPVAEQPSRNMLAPGFPAYLNVHLVDAAAPAPPTKI